MANILETSMDYLAQFDPEIASQMQSEYQRQQRNIELIASENIASPAVIAAMGSVLTNKYAEGYPGKRYYGGCEVVDVIEQIAIDRAKQLFGAEYANVQPHSGAQANLAAYMAVLQPGDTIVGMDLANGGHRSSSSRARRPIRAPSSSKRLPRLRTAMARFLWWTWPTSPVSSRAANT